MKYKVVTIWFLTFFIVGCELEGDDGVSGAQGESGPQGEPGPQGITGLSCWDLNEDGNKTMPDEDTNSDGVIDVYDCRTIIDLSPTNTLVNSTTQTITNQHTRQSYSSAFALGITLFTGSSEDYENATVDGNWHALDNLAADPIQDPCGLWKWESTPGGSYKLQAENAVAYNVRHMLAIALYSADPAEDAHFGFEQCQNACLSDNNCTGAFYSVEDGTDNSLNCKLLRDVGFEIDSATEFSGFQTEEIGFASANIQNSPIYIGVISVCE